MERTQERSHIEIATPLQDAQILLRSFTTDERLGRPFRIDADLLSDFEIPLEDLLGHNVTIRLTPDLGRDLHMYFNGFVSRLAHVELEEGLWVYRATIVPWLWFLTRTADCLIFQNKSVPEIIEEVFRGKGFSEFENELSETYEPREYCVQYRESDLDFVTRLMEEEGIYYFFRHENGKHTLVLADSPSAHQPVPGRETIPYRSQDEGSSAAGHAIRTWSVEAQVLPGAVILNDFDFTNPQPGRLIGRGMIQRGHAVPEFEVFDYPGLYTTPEAAERCSRLRIEAVHSEYEIVQGSSEVRELAAGWTFELEGHPREDQNREYLITAIQRRAVDSAFTDDGEPLYESEFTGIKSDEPYRLPRTTHKRLIYGPQTAIVVGPEGQEIHTDEHGRVKVLFHWDRMSPGDQDSSCWVRVAQGMAGNRWGSIFLPRIGQEVIVEFLEGDPDRPLITGRVYNGRNALPYPLPDNATVSTTKTNTSPDGNGFNEIRFEDKKDSEQLFVHAQRRMDVRVRGSLFATAAGNREEIVGHEEKGDLNRTVCNDINMHNKGGRFDMTDKAVNRTVKEDVVEDHQKKQTLKVAERLTLNATEIAAEAGDALSLKSDTTTVQGAQALNLKAGSVFIEGTQEIHLKSGGNFIVINSSGVSIKGMQVMINSGGASQGAGSPLTIEDPEIEEPIDAVAASTVAPGERRAGGGGSPRTRTRRTLPLVRAPEPPPPRTPGTTGFGPNTADEVELIEVVEHAGPWTGALQTQPVENRRQFVNLPRTTSPSGTQDKRNGRVIHIRARIQWNGSGSGSLAGRSVRFYAQPAGANKAPATLHEGLRAGFERAGGAMNKTVQTVADGWTPFVEFHVSRYGGDKFQLFATLLGTDTGGIDGGEYEVWRRVQFEVDAMQRPSGVDYMDVANGVIPQFVAAHAAAFTEVVQVGSNSSPGHQRLLNYSGLNTFHTSCANASGTRYIHLMYVDTVLTGDREELEATFAVVVPAGATPVTLALDALQATFKPAAAGWVISATWTNPAGGATGNVPSGNFTSPVATGEYARHRNQGGDFDRWEFNVRLNGTGAPVGATVHLRVRYRSEDYLSGVQIGQTTTVGMRFRELRANGGTMNLANATLQTSIHESSHAFGLASRQLPNGTNNPTFTTGGGGHCTFTATCVMTPALHQHTAFCDRCADNLRARKLEAINVSPGDAMV